MCVFIRLSFDFVLNERRNSVTSWADLSELISFNEFLNDINELPNLIPIILTKMRCRSRVVRN